MVHISALKKFRIFIKNFFYSDNNFIVELKSKTISHKLLSFDNIIILINNYLKY